VEEQSRGSEEVPEQQARGFPEQQTTEIPAEQAIGVPEQQVEINPDALAAGLKSILSGAKPQLSDEQVKEAMTSLQTMMQSKMAERMKTQQSEQKEVGEKNKKEKTGHAQDQPEAMRDRVCDFFDRERIEFFPDRRRHVLRYVSKINCIEFQCL